MLTLSRSWSSSATDEARSVSFSMVRPLSSERRGLAGPIGIVFGDSGRVTRAGRGICRGRVDEAWGVWEEEEWREAGKGGTRDMGWAG